MLCPGAVALLLTRFLYREPVVPALSLRFRPSAWFVLAWLLPVAVSFAALGLNLVPVSAHYSATMRGLPSEMESYRASMSAGPIGPLWTTLLCGLLMGPTSNTLGGLGEELGWRGFLQRELAPLGFWRASALNGLLWGLCHVPLWLEGYGGSEHRFATLAAILAETLLLAPLLAYLKSRADSVLPCAIFHGTLGSTRLIAMAFVIGAGAWTLASIPLVLGVLCVALLAVLHAKSTAFNMSR